MVIINYLNEFDFEYDIQGVLRSFYPGAYLKTVMSAIEKNEIPGIISDAKNSVNVVDTLAENFIMYCDFDDKYMKLKMAEIYVDDSLKETDKVQITELVCGNIKRVFFENNYDRRETKNVLKRELYLMLKKITGKDLPWGTLSGIRPTKISSEMLENGMTEQEIFDQLKKDYFISDIKAKESIQISNVEKNILDKIDYKNGYSIYIGIPFCPSTCLYCSFTSNPIFRFKNKIDDYLQAMFKELEFIKTAMAAKKLCSIYIGGGTPTTLSPEHLEKLLSKVESLFDTDKIFEFTIEAGRPDSITEEKLKVIKSHRITRISINPQTMKDETLKIIGRNHTIEQFEKAYALARNMGFDNINMDFILGLPGEDIEDVKHSMARVKELKPESLTIHSLAIKRAARLNLEQRAGIKYEITNTEDMMQVTMDTAEELGLVPYYLYRQKNMAGNLENVGYSLPGKEGVYNILIMEEKQPILAVGAGASTKMVYGDGRIERSENVKDIDLYIEKIHEMIERKRKLLV